MLRAIASLSECCMNLGTDSADDLILPMAALSHMNSNDMKRFYTLLDAFPKKTARTFKVGYSSKTLLHAAAESGHKEALKILLKGHFINVDAPGVLHSHENQETLSRMTPLMFAVYRHQLDAVDLLLEYGADVNAKNSKGETAFMIWQRLNICDTVPHQFEASASQNSSETALLIDKLNKPSAPVSTELEHSEYMCRIC